MVQWYSFDKLSVEEIVEAMNRIYLPEPFSLTLKLEQGNYTISGLGVVLWQSEDDDRRYKNLEMWEQESLEECLRRRLKDYITELAKEEI